MKTKLLALAALSVLTLGVATGCQKTPKATDVTVAAATEWDIDTAAALMEGSLVRINDQSIVTGKHGNTIFIQQVTGDTVGDIHPMEVELTSSEDAESIAVRDWVVVEGTVTTVNGRVVLKDAKLINKETKSKDESPLYGYNGTRSFWGDVGRSYSGFLGFDVVLELAVVPGQLTAGTDTTLTCVYPGEPTDEESLLTYGVEVVIPGDLDTNSFNYMNVVLNGGTVTYTDGTSETLEAMKKGDQISFSVLHFWFDNYMKFVVADIDARNCEQNIIPEIDTALSALLIENFKTSTNYSQVGIYQEKVYANEGTLDSPKVSADAKPTESKVYTSSMKFTDSAAQIDPDENGDKGTILANTETGVTEYTSTGSKDGEDNVVVNWNVKNTYDGAVWTDFFYTLKDIVDNGYAKQFQEVKDQAGTFEAANAALDLLISNMTGSLWFSSTEFANLQSAYKGSSVLLADTTLTFMSVWSGWFYTDESHTAVIFDQIICGVQISLASIGTTTVTVPTTSAE